MEKQKQVAVVMGSKSDEAIVKKCLEVLDQFEIGYECQVLSAHRTPNKAARFAREAQSKGFKVLIAAAGLAAALPGVLAAHTTLPVIGIPIAAGALQGKDALYSIVQMPPGIPVACVGIDGAKNAAYLALSILSLMDAEIQAQLQDFRKGHGDLE